MLSESDVVAVLSKHSTHERELLRARHGYHFLDDITFVLRRNVAGTTLFHLRKFLSGKMIIKMLFLYYPSNSSYQIAFSG